MDLPVSEPESRAFARPGGVRGVPEAVPPEHVREGGLDLVPQLLAHRRRGAAGGVCKVPPAQFVRQRMPPVITAARTESRSQTGRQTGCQTKCTAASATCHHCSAPQDRAVRRAVRQAVRQAVIPSAS